MFLPEGDPGRKVPATLGLDDYERSVFAPSGGWRTRVALQHDPAVRAFALTRSELLAVEVEGEPVSGAHG
jgi:hypothetical protein